MINGTGFGYPIRNTVTFLHDKRKRKVNSLHVRVHITYYCTDKDNKDSKEGLMFRTMDGELVTGVVLPKGAGAHAFAFPTQYS